MKEKFDVKEYTNHFALRLVLFAFMGIGWDVLMTLLQKFISGKITISAICPASAWMYFAYFALPIALYPTAWLVERFTNFYVVKILAFLMVFYCYEFAFGYTLQQFGAIPWSYDWFLDPKWTLMGIITWHPAFLVAWTIFVMLGYELDERFRKGVIYKSDS
ncbi:MAG: hypothetical protein ABFS45_14285 [Pseudomonadota bacterium]